MRCLTEIKFFKLNSPIFLFLFFKSFRKSLRIFLKSSVQKIYILVNIKLIILVFLYRLVAQPGQRARLITVRSWVRIPASLLLLILSLILLFFQIFHLLSILSSFFNIFIDFALFNFYS